MECGVLCWRMVAVSLSSTKNVLSPGGKQRVRVTAAGDIRQQRDSQRTRHDSVRGPQASEHSVHWAQSAAFSRNIATLEGGRRREGGGGREGGGREGGGGEGGGREGGDGGREGGRGGREGRGEEGREGGACVMHNIVIAS